MANPVAEAQALASARPRFEFTIPESERDYPSDPRTVTFQLISIAEENMANQAAESTKNPFAYEALKHAVVAANGSPVTWDAGAKERFIEGCSAKVRTLLLRAFERLHAPSAKGSDDFFASMKASV